MAVSTSPSKLPSPKAVLEPSPLALLRGRAFGHIGLVLGGTILVVVCLMAVLAPVLGPHDPYVQDLSHRLINPIWHADGTWTHPLGTDGFGRDYLSRVLYGARVSLMIGFGAMLISSAIGSALGIAAGYFGGRVDMGITLIITTRLAMPVVLIALVVVALIGNSLQIVIIVLGLLIWDRFAVVIRSSTQQIRNLDFVMAARAVGCSPLRMVLTEIMPNVLNNLIVVATLEMAHAILLEAALSFLGLGVQPPTPSWGLMISEAKGYMFFAPWLIGIPGLALFSLVLGINLLGDGIRDVTAPESQA